jgi:hypothetical protein
MRDRYRRLRMAGIAPHVALALAEAGFDVLGFVPLGWAGGAA